MYRVVIIAKYIQSYEVKEDEIGMACRMHGEKTSYKGFGGEPKLKR
jgi:hypothetical protein